MKPIQLICFGTIFINLNPVFIVDSHRFKRRTVECPYGVLENMDDNFNLFLTVNSLFKYGLFTGMKERNIEMNWSLPPDAKSTDWVGLFDKKPDNDSSGALLEVNATKFDGYFKTNFDFPKLRNARQYTSFRSACAFSYWIGYVDESGRTLKSNCLRIRPNWMSEERNVIGDIPIYALMIPGTHNSGSYRDIDNAVEDNIFTRYTINQYQDVMTQLVYGIRFLDLRVGRFEGSPVKFWVMHDISQMNPLYKVVQDVRHFMRTTNEIVIMDFHRFPIGFESPEHHAELIKYLTDELGEFMAPDWLTEQATPNDFWSLNRTLIVSYANFRSALNHQSIWFKVRHAWGNKRKPKQLRKFIQGVMEQKQSATYLWSAMAHLTPSQLDVIFNLSGGAANFNNQIARKITSWFRDKWWNAANVVATDFFLSNDIINVAIDSNQKRKTCIQQQYWMN